jgi:hypothetical protein
MKDSCHVSQARQLVSKPLLSDTVFTANMELPAAVRQTTLNESIKNRRDIAVPHLLCPYMCEFPTSSLGPGALAARIQSLDAL